MHETPRDIEEIEKKISVLKEKQNTEIKKHTNLSQGSIGLNAAIELVSGTFVGMSIGYILDELFDFDSVFLIIFTIIGGLAGLLNIARYIKSSNYNKEDK